MVYPVHNKKRNKKRKGGRNNFAWEGQITLQQRGNTSKAIIILLLSGIISLLNESIATVAK